MTKIKQKESATTQHIHLKPTRMAEMNLVIFKTREGLLRNTATHKWVIQIVRMDLGTVVRMAMLPRSKRASWYDAQC
jgi:hypothetical protein